MSASKRAAERIFAAIDVWSEPDHGMATAYTFDVEKAAEIIEQESPSFAGAIKLLELRLWLLRHVRSLKAMVQLLQEKGPETAAQRLDQIVDDAKRVIEAQAVDQMFDCPDCGKLSPVLLWAQSEGECPECGYFADPLAD